MKIAFVGKGGSGKSTVSWLAIQMLAAEGRQVLAIDADHNMDLVSLLGQEIGKDTPTMHRLHDEFRAQVGQEEDKHWEQIVLDGRALPTFTLAPKDSYTGALSLPAAPAIELIAVGLGAEDVLFSDRCAHGHSAALKYYLPLLKEGEEADVVIDGVAGADMMNFGLFLGTDGVVVVVEPHPNSMRVLAQVAAIAKRTSLPLFVVVNKTGTNPDLADELDREWGDRIVGRIPADPALLAYDFERLSLETKQEASAMLVALRARTEAEESDPLERLRYLETERQKVRI